MGYKLYLNLETIPQSLNVKLRRHWSKNHRERTMWTTYLRCNIANLPREPLTKAKITLVRHSHRMLDFDGVVGSMKPVVDALKHVGVLSDDSWSVLGAWTVDQKFRAKSDGPRLEILVQEMPDKRN